MKTTIILTLLAMASGGAAYALDTEIEAEAEAGIEAEAEAEADIVAGEEAYQGVCRNCHGPKAQGVASYPMLSDKEVEYLVERLERYREGEKIGPNSMLMIPHATELSDQDILDISHYIVAEFGEASTE
ncbi:c-type cytochrome [Limimaricola soesokkakensis]|uniref:c-type cytochrome n=1 Tax=Limimaricola soesokkakensis TaxID=1343159 RepID=UPI0035111BCF